MERGLSLKPVIVEKITREQKNCDGAGVGLLAILVSGPDDQYRC